MWPAAIFCAVTELRRLLLLQALVAAGEEAAEELQRTLEVERASVASNAATLAAATERAQVGVEWTGLLCCVFCCAQQESWRRIPKGIRKITSRVFRSSTRIVSA